MQNFVRNSIIALFIFLCCSISNSYADRPVEIKASEKSGAGVVERKKLYSKSYALVIGNDQYKYWQKLHEAVNDAKIVAKELEKKGFEVDLQYNLDSNSLKEKMNDFFAFKGENPNSRLLLWFSGHGHTDGGRGYIVPTDAVADGSSSFFRAKAVSMSSFKSMVLSANAKHVLSVFDSCFSGTIFRTRGGGSTPKAITKKTIKPVRQFITSGDAGELVRDDGAFRTIFIRAISGEGEADFNHDSYVTGEELGLFLSQKISHLTRSSQTPQSGKLNDLKYNQGDFVFFLPYKNNPEINENNNPEINEALKRGGGTVESKEGHDEMPRVVGVARKFDGINFVWIPAGTFMMGSKERDASPMHLVSIDGFWMAQYEIQLKEFKRFVDATGYITEAEKRKGCAIFDDGWRNKRSFNWKNPGFNQRDESPVVCVSWNDTQQYLYWLNSSSNSSYRLASESEWEYAARAGSTEDYSFGSSKSKLCKYANGADESTDFQWKNRYCSDGVGNMTAAVGSFSANKLGLYDMHGNVWEWSADCWHENYQNAPPSGEAWVSGECDERIIRGGSWATYSEYLRSAKRKRYAPNVVSNSIGFRIVRKNKY